MHNFSRKLIAENLHYITFTILKFVSPGKIYSDVSWNILVLLRANAITAILSHSSSLHLSRSFFLLVIILRVVAVEIASVRNLGRRGYATGRR